nr:PREDICTED: nuclear respiratory factor 1 [Latimeria chalumnae]|eukprot:XP_014346931.1 PREDICTED: nuclear respiratory factor 1 [Latimeria chalumnae]
MEEQGVNQAEHMGTIEAHTVAQQVQQVHVATYTEHSMLSGDEDSPSSPEDNSYDDSDILNSTGTDEVTAHLAAAGPVGMAAAAAVATGKKRKRPHVFESNPSIRKRQQTRLLRKLRTTLDEYTTRVGQQAIVLCISPSKPNAVFKVFGAAPLENVVSLLNKSVSWTQALRTIVKNCYKQHGREDLLYAFEDQLSQQQGGPTHSIAHLVPSQTVVQTISNPDGTVSLIQIRQPTQQQATSTHSNAHLVPSQTVVRTINNPDGTVSLVQVEQNWATLQGGEMTIQTTQASEATQAVASLAEAAVAASQEMQQGATVTMALNSEAAAHAVATLAEATLQGGGQIVLSGETAAAVGALTGVQDANGLVQIPVSMYQTVVTSLAQGNGPVQVAMAPVTTRISDSSVTMDGQAVEVVTLEQ